MPIFVPLHPPRDPEECPAWLFEALERLNRHALIVNQQVAAVVRGEAPDGSGSTLLDLTKYFYKPGIPGGQRGFGGTNASDPLTFSSTASQTKGFMYFGIAASGIVAAAIDETNRMMGVGTATPAATMHLRQSGLGGVTTLLPANDVNNGNHGSGDLAGVTTVGTVTGWSVYTGAGTPVAPPCYTAINNDDGTARWIADQNTDSGGSNPQVCGLSAAAPTGRGIWTITYTACWLSPPSAGSKLIKFRLVLSDGKYYESPSIDVQAIGTVFTRFTTTIDTSSGGVTAGTPNSIEIFGPNAVAYFLCTYISASYGSATPILRWDDTSGNQLGQIDSVGQAGIGTGSSALAAMLTVLPYQDEVGLVVKANVVQLSNLQEWQSNAGVAASWITYQGAGVFTAEDINGTHPAVQMRRNASGGQNAWEVTNNDASVIYASMEQLGRILMLNSGTAYLRSFGTNVFEVMDSTQTRNMLYMKVAYSGGWSDGVTSGQIGFFHTNPDGARLIIQNSTQRFNRLGFASLRTIFDSNASAAVHAPNGGVVEIWNRGNAGDNLFRLVPNAAQNVDIVQVRDSGDTTTLFGIGSSGALTTGRIKTTVLLTDDVTPTPKLAQFDLSPVSVGATRVLQIGDWNGKIAAPVGDGTATQVLTSNGASQPSWQSAGVVSGSTQTEIDFGATPVAEASFTVTDARVTATSKIIGEVSYEAPTGKDLDELEMDGLDLKFGPGSGQFTIYARGLDGYVADKFKINYLVAP